MLHLIKYRFIQTVRDKTTMFWSLVFPLVLGTLFFFSFGKGAFDEILSDIPVAYVEENQNAEEGKAFTEYLNSFDGEFLNIKGMSEKEAQKALAENRVEGIYYDSPSLSISSNGVVPSILQTLLDSYVRNEAVLKDIAKEHPERMPAAVKALEGYKKMTEDMSAGGRSLDTGLTFFFALIAMSCLYGCFPGEQAMLDTRANLSALGARQCISPTHKIKRIAANCIVIYGIQFVNSSIALFFVKYVLRMDLGDRIGGMLLVCLLGSMIGVSLGIMIGVSGKTNEGTKVGLLIGSSMIMCFLGGLMTPDIKSSIELHMPIINRINPAALISDAFYCLSVYNDTAKFTQCLLSLGIISAGMLVIGFLLVRRERYDSI